jgi:N-acetylmuramoyl-L-alanine amidase
VRRLRRALAAAALLLTAAVAGLPTSGVRAGIAAGSGAVAAPGAGAASSAAVTVERAGSGTTETVPTRTFEGHSYMGANALARLVGGTKYWRPDLRKLEIRTVRHTLRLTVDAPYAVVDEVATRLAAPVRLVDGEVQVPLDVFPLALSGRFVPKADFNPATHRLLLFTEEPNLGPPVLEASAPRTRLGLPATAATLEPVILSARRSRFLVEVTGGVLTAVPGDSLPGQGLLQRVRFRRETGGVLLDLAIAPEAQAYRVRVPTGQSVVEVEFAPEPAPGFVPFAPEYGAPPGRPLRVLVLDPGHGGADSGYVAAPGLREKDLTLALARALRDRLRQRLPGVEVRLTRENDVTLPPTARVEAANRAHCDLFLSLHYDGVPGSAARGVSATVAPPLGFDIESAFGAPAAGERPGAARPLALVLVPWRDAAGRYASDSRGVAELLLAALSADGRAPARLRQARVLPIEGANMPAVMLECGMLSNADDRARVTGPQGTAQLADVLARALERYAGGGFWP